MPPPPPKKGEKTTKQELNVCICIWAFDRYTKVLQQCTGASNTSSTVLKSESDNFG